MGIAARLAILWFTSVVLCAGVAASPHVASPEQLISVADLPKVVVFGDPMNMTYNAFPDQVYARSEDGRRMAVVVRRGNPLTGKNEASIVIYDAASLMTDPRPKPVASFASSGKSQPISFVRWLSDNETLVFAATRGAAVSQVYSVNVRTQTLTELTHDATPLVWFSITSSGDRLLTLRERPMRPMVQQDQDCRHACRVSGNWLVQAERLIPSEFDIRVLDLRKSKVWRSREIRSPETQLPEVSSCYPYPYLPGGLSPDGRFVLRKCEVKRWPSWWSDYTADPDLTGGESQRRLGYGELLLLTDLDTGDTRPITDTPFTSSAAEPIWIDGGRLLALPGTLQSLDGFSEPERLARSRTWATVFIDPRTRRITASAALPDEVARVTGASWDPVSNVLTIQSRDRSGQALPLRYLQKSGAGWNTSPVVPPTDPVRDRVEVVVEQSPNDPPRLVARDNRDGTQRTIMEPNAWLSAKRLGRVEEISWKSKDGRSLRGGIIYPPGYVAGQRYPLLIQAYNFSAKRFTLNGYSQNFPGQALAAHGVIVFQAATNLKGVQNTPQEWPVAMAGYESAVDELDARGLIDRKRVALQGWSASGPQLGYMLTQSDYEFAAAAFTATADAGWWYYLEMGGGRDVEALFGDAPFGKGLEPWLENSPSFNLERVRTPIFMWNNVSVAGLWDWYAGLRRLDKPVESWVLPNGQHDVFDIRDRMALNQLLVDWFVFWLKDEEDSDPAKAEQYKRWHVLRAQQQEVMRRPRPPLLDWTATPRSTRQLRE